MIVSIESKARPCLGVDRAISMAEDALRHGQTVYSIGQIVHNTREIERLQKLGLKQIESESFTRKEAYKQKYRNADLLLRAHGSVRQ